MTKEQVERTAETATIASSTTPKRIVLSFEQIEPKLDTVIEWLPIPEWAPDGAEDPDAYGVFVKSMNGRERAHWQEMTVTQMGKNAKLNYQNMTTVLVVMAACDEHGKRIFSEDQAKALGRKNSAILERIGDVANRLSGIGEDEKEAIAGNSNGSLSDDSLTD